VFVYIYYTLLIFNVMLPLVECGTLGIFAIYKIVNFISKRHHIDKYYVNFILDVLFFSFFIRLDGL